MTNSNNIDEIVKNYNKNIKYVIRSLTGNNNVNDIEQEVYVKAWKNLPKYENKGNIWSWLKVITVNTCKDHLKSKYNAQKKVTINDDTNFYFLKDKKLTPENTLLQEERHKTILDAIHNLKPKFKEIILFYDIEELSYEEISQKIKRPVGTVKSRLFNARKNLQESLKDLIEY